jgi:transposase-like protein
MSKRTRRHYTTEQKTALLKKHFVDKVPVSQICEENQLQPSVFYHWQRQLFENAPAVFDVPKGARTPTREKQLEERVAQLEAKLAKKDGVIAEISAEYVQLKKELGEP